ncbi:hypothetical protein ACPCHT_15800 [Nucisporomicrobium flavum]|jgi:hypothetical protein|uniref:hypothetical protein n=1 Tax=Nucisporomicrobium flavum TaxID=2785915 RepID=UPI0018F56E12|nr:hypothetical protein [Nucisporomicrobium flavum]
MTDSKPTGEVVVAPSTVSRKIFYTAASGVLTFLITNALEQPVATSVTLSILIGGIFLMVRFLVDFERRLAVVEALSRAGQKRMENLVSEAFAKIDDATELFRLIEASKLPEGLVEGLVRHSTKITPHSPSIVYQFVQAELQDMSECLKQLSEGGTVTYYGEDRDWLLGLTTYATTSIDAISLASVDRGLWYSEIGQRYMEAQRQAVEREVAVRRIFILEPDDDADIGWACDEQRKVGIHVRVLERSRIPAALKVQVLDFIIFDEVVSYETTPAAAVTDTDRPAVAETQLVLREHRVRDRVRVFEALWGAAREPGDAVAPAQRNA